MIFSIYIIIYNHIHPNEPTLLPPENTSRCQSSPCPTTRLWSPHSPAWRQWSWKWTGANIRLFYLGLKTFIWSPTAAAGNWDPGLGSAPGNEGQAIGIFEKLHPADDELHRRWEVSLAYIKWETASLAPLNLPKGCEGGWNWGVGGVPGQFPEGLQSSILPRIHGQIHFLTWVFRTTRNLLQVLQLSIGTHQDYRLQHCPPSHFPWMRPLLHSQHIHQKNVLSKVHQRHVQTL